jgi:hypothetical protein
MRSCVYNGGQPESMTMAALATTKKGASRMSPTTVRADPTASTMRIIPQLQ